MVMTFKLTALAAAALAVTSLSSTAARADGPIEGATGQFEIDYLQFILDHHYSGLRATELGAGTAAVGATVSAPYPGNPSSFPTSLAKGTNDVVLAISNRANMAQGMEITQGQGFLQNWYGITASLDITPDGQMMLNSLEGGRAG